ncbi:MAG TPA: response regulator [Opitutus sp.]|nr:response regulator [Opitutus sp.]
MTKILLIEDEPTMRKNMLRMLSLEGYDTVGAEDGEAGLAAVRAQRPDIVLCDVMMPKLDGFGVLAAVRRDPELRQIPFVFLTARGETCDVRTGMNLGADDYLVKPVDAGDLLAAIHARLQRQTSRELR